MLIAMAGLPGTGKSALARALAAALPAVVLDKDCVRAALFPPEEVEYTTSQDDFCVDVLLQAAAYLLRKDPAKIVIIDGRTFSRHTQVAALVRAADHIGAPLELIECVCSAETAIERLNRDRATGCHPAANRDAALYDAVKARFEPLVIPHLVVDTDRPLETCLAACLHYLRA
jgi:adenylylsulfate kinase